MWARLGLTLYHVEVYLRYTILRLDYEEYETRRLVIMEAPTAISHGSEREGSDRGAVESSRAQTRLKDGLSKVDPMVP